MVKEKSCICITSIIVFLRKIFSPVISLADTLRAPRVAEDVAEEEEEGEEAVRWEAEAALEMGSMLPGSASMTSWP